MMNKAIQAIVITVCVVAAAVIMLTHLRPKGPAMQPREAGSNVNMVGTIGVMKMRGGKVVEEQSVDKTLVGAGIRQLIAILIGDSSNVYDTAAYVCIGNDSTATDTSMTALQGATKTWANVDSVTHSANWVKWWRTFTTAQANQAWYETSIWNDSAGIMLDRAAHGSWGTKTTADTWILYVKVAF